MEQRQKKRLARSELEEIVRRAVAEMIAERVVERLGVRKRRALVLCTGSLAGAGSALESLSRLHRQGWDLKVVLSRGAQEVFSEEEVKRRLPAELLADPQDGRAMRSLMADRDFLILPTLTVNAASKIANLIADEPVSNAAAFALARGKQVIACIDGCCPDRRAHLPGGFNASEAYRRQMREHLKMLKSYGIVLTDAAGLPEEAGRQALLLLRRELSSGAPAVSGSVGGEAKPVSGEPRRLGKRVIGKGDVMELAEGTRILIGQEAVVTQTAEDEARRRDISLVRG